MALGSALSERVLSRRVAEPMTGLCLMTLGAHLSATKRKSCPARRRERSE